MLEKRDETATIIVIALLDRKQAGDLLAPALIIDKAGIWPRLAQLADWYILEGNNGSSVGDGSLPIAIRGLGYRIIHKMSICEYIYDLRDDRDGL